MSKSAAVHRKRAGIGQILKLSLIALTAGFFLGALLMEAVQNFISLHQNGAPSALSTRSAKSETEQDELEEQKEEELENIEDLRSRNLEFPVQGQTLGDTRDSFSEARAGHLHEAIDILAPRKTPVVAVEGGRIAKLWYSRYGGVTIYQFDPDEKYAYYYAHLESYAWNLSEGDSVKRGEIIGYVGTSGNAPPDTPHLHFAIFKLNDDKNWWEGEALNPYDIYKP